MLLSRVCRFQDAIPSIELPHVITDSTQKFRKNEYFDASWLVCDMESCLDLCGLQEFQGCVRDPYERRKLSSHDLFHPLYIKAAQRSFEHDLPTS